MLRVLSCRAIVSLLLSGGVHGTAAGEGGDGIVQVTDLQFVP